MTIRILARTQELNSFCQEAAQQGSVALDMEFERERTYYAKLQLVQIATSADNAVLVDPLSEELDLEPLWQLVADPAVETIIHAGGQDLEIFYRKASRLPANLFDTQVAGALLGLGEQPGYADLLRKVLDVRLQKHERVTDWGRRPLSDGQQTYALNDVVYLHTLRDHLEERLNERGRRAWLEEELAFYGETRTYEPDLRQLWRRVGRHRSLRAPELAVLRELAIWREETAQRRDIPRNRVAADDVLIDLARRSPRRVEDMRSLRRLHPREVERSGKAMLAAVQRGRECPQEDLPSLPEIQREDPALGITTDLLAVFVRNRAREAKIAYGYLATKRDLAELVSSHQGRRRPGKMRLLEGWRYELVGRDLQGVLDGNAFLGVDPDSGLVRIIDSSREDSEP